MHRPAGRAIGGRRVGLSLEEVGETSKPGDFAQREETLRGELDFLRGSLRDFGEPRVGHEDGRLAVVDDVGDLRPDKVPIDRREVETDLHRGEVQCEELDGVWERDGDSITGREPLRAEGVREPVRESRELSIGDLTGSGIDDRHAFRLVGGDLPHSELLGHVPGGGH